MNTRINLTQLDEYFFNLTVNIMSGFQTDFNISVNSSYQRRDLFLYLTEPSTGASLIEPNSIQLSPFSPYIKIELRKFAINSSDLHIDVVRVGFANVSTPQHPNPFNQSIYLADYDFTFAYTLDWPKLANRSRNLENLFHLKWRATLLDFSEIRMLNSNASIRDILNCSFYNKLEPDVCEGLIVCEWADVNCSFNLRFKLKIPNLLELYGLRISLLPFNAFFYETRTLNVSVHNESNEAFLYLKTSLFSKVGFNKYSLFSVHDRFKVFAQLAVERSGMINNSLELVYSTLRFNASSWFDFAGFQVYPAIAEYDYKDAQAERARFAPGQDVMCTIYPISTHEAYLRSGVLI